MITKKTCSYSKNGTCIKRAANVRGDFEKTGTVVVSG